MNTWSEESRKRLGETRRKLFAQGSLRNSQRKIQEVPKVKVSSDFGHWFAGFVDGEGCFSIKRARTGGIQTTFRLALRDDDTPILREIQATLGFGNVLFSKTKTTNVATYHTASFAGCMAIVLLFRKYNLRSKKRPDFEAWARIVDACFHRYNPRYEDFQADLQQMQDAKSYKDGAHGTPQRACSDQ